MAARRGNCATSRGRHLWLSAPQATLSVPIIWTPALRPAEICRTTPDGGNQKVQGGI
jgi:hypothetical protein